MSFWTRIYYRLLNLPIKLLVKIQPIPLEPVPELSLNTKKHIFYVLPYDSKADLLALRKSCRELGLEDPLQPLNIHGHKLPHFIFLDKGPRVFNYLLSKESTRQSFHHVIALHQQYPDLDVQMLPVSVMFGRSPGKEGSKPPSLRLLNGVQKFFAVLLDGRQCFVRYSDTVSFRQIADNLGTELSTAHKLVRVARIHFYRQRLAALGPKLPDRKVMFEKLLKSPAIEKALEDEIKSKKITPNKAQKNARSMLNEIAADFTYRMIRLTGHVLSWTWSRLYQGLKVSNIESIRKLAQEGHGIVYAPCHRSHMDYLLLSYVLYKQGLVPPHIAAGVNLNFWPAGPLFRRLGAFFIRRTFKDKLYTAVFREYFAELFYRGYSVEYFIEGGRSRTGRLLDPKTGTLTMTIQSMLRGDMRSIMIVPVYIGYEHVMEVGTYAKELRGAEKKKESLWQILKALPRLKRLGFGYVNFGEPISLTNYLNKHAPQWRESIDPIEPQRPSWLLPTSIKLSEEIMERINRAAAVNAMNLCCTALLASRQRALTKEMLESQINCYLALLRNVKYSKPVTIPDLDAPSLIAHATQMNKFNIEHDSAGGIIRLSREQAVLSTYYRNNVQHLFAIPSLVASIIMNKICIKREELINDIICLYPFLKAELFIHFKSEELTDYIQAIVNELLNQSLIVEKEGVLSVRHANIITLQLLAAGIRETAQRYAIAFSLMYYNPKISRVELERESRLIAHRLSILHGINAPEFFDKGVFAILINTLRKEKYLTSEELEPEKIYRLLDLVCQLLTPDVKQTIKSVSLKEVAQLPLPEVETDIKIDADIGAEIKPEPDKTPSK